MSEPIARRGARVLLLDAAGRVLLLHGHDPRTPHIRYWFTIGGGVDAGESDREGAARELLEETGLRVDPAALEGPVHHEVDVFPFDGRRYRQEQGFYVHRVGVLPIEDVDTSGFEPAERATVDAWRWWSADELRATDETWYPAELAELVDRHKGPRPPSVS